MQFVLKDGFVYIVNNRGLAGSKVEADVVVKYVDDFENRKFSYSVNGSTYRPIENEKIIFEDADLKKPYIDLKVKATNGNDILIFKSDTVPVTYAVIFGQEMDKAYPEKIKELENRLTRVHRSFEEKQQETRIKLGKVLSHVIEIEKRGSLF